MNHRARWMGKHNPVQLNTKGKLLNRYTPPHMRNVGPVLVQLEKYKQEEREKTAMRTKRRNDRNHDFLPFFFSTFCHSHGDGIMGTSWRGFSSSGRGFSFSELEASRECCLLIPLISIEFTFFPDCDSIGSCGDFF